MPFLKTTYIFCLKSTSEAGIAWHFCCFDWHWGGRLVLKGSSCCCLSRLAHPIGSRSATVACMSVSTLRPDVGVIRHVGAFSWYLEITDDIRWILTLMCSAISPWSLTFQVPLDIIPSVEIVLCGLLSSSLTWIRFSSSAPGHMFGVIFIMLYFLLNFILRPKQDVFLQPQCGLLVKPFEMRFFFIRGFVMYSKSASLASSSSTLSRRGRSRISLGLARMVRFWCLFCHGRREPVPEQNWQCISQNECYATCDNSEDCVGVKYQYAQYNST